MAEKKTTNKKATPKKSTAKKPTSEKKVASKVGKIKDVIRSDAKSLYPKRPPRGRVSEQNLEKLADKVSKL